MPLPGQGTAVADVEQAARTAHDSTAVAVLARLGLAARGLVFLVLGLLALSVARGSDAQADQSGALEQVQETPVGGPLLLVLGIGFAGYAAWLLLEAAVGDGALDRLRSGAKGLVYAALSVSTFRFLSRGEGGASAESRTAQVMEQPGGRAVVAVAGLALLGIGAYLAYKGLRRKHAECLEGYRVPRRLHRPAVVVGAVGYVGRGVTLGLVGAFLLRAAASSDSTQAKGLDAALQAVASQPYGRVLLALTAVGVLAYALWSFVEAAYRDLDQPKG